MNMYEIPDKRKPSEQLAQEMLDALIEAGYYPVRSEAQRKLDAAIRTATEDVEAIRFYDPFQKPFRATIKHI